MEKPHQQHATFIAPVGSLIHVKVQARTHIHDCRQDKPTFRPRSHEPNVFLRTQQTLYTIPTPQLWSIDGYHHIFHGQSPSPANPHSYLWIQKSMKAVGRQGGITPHWIATPCLHPTWNPWNDMQGLQIFLCEHGPIRAKIASICQKIQGSFVQAQEAAEISKDLVLMVASIDAVPRPFEDKLILCIMS